MRRSTYARAVSVLMGSMEMTTAVALSGAGNPSAQACEAVGTHARPLVDARALDAVVRLTGQLVANGMRDATEDLRPVALRLQRSHGKLRVLVSLAGWRGALREGRQIWFDFPLDPWTVN